MSARIELRLADITTQEVDAIVNAANSHLAHGGGVAAAIARAAGPALLAESADAPFVPTGSAHATTAGDLPSRFVIHAVGPVWSGGDQDEEDLLASAYIRALGLADRLGCRSVALPSISTGIYGFPLSRAAVIALEAVDGALRQTQVLELARFCLFSTDDLEAYRNASNAASIRLDVIP